MNRKGRAERGVALLTAMLVVLFLLVLTGALVRTQSGLFAIAQASDARARSRAACQSLYDFCVYQLEHRRDWGAGGFVGVADVDPPRPVPGGVVPLDSRIEITSAGHNVFRGYLSEHDAGFEVEVINALTSSARTSAEGLNTPAEHVRLSITAWEGRDPKDGSRSRQQVDCLLRLAPLFDASILSRGNVALDVGEVVFASKDPFRNEIRGEGDISLPGLRTGRSLFVKHNRQVTLQDANLASMTRDRTGLLWAGGDISDGATSLEGEDLSDAAAASGGRLVNQTTGRADIYDLKPENIPQPDFAHDIVVPPGEFRFTRAKVKTNYRVQVTKDDGRTVTEERQKEENVDVLEYYDPPGSESPLKVMRSAAGKLDTGEELVSSEITYGKDLKDIPVVVGDRFAVDDSYQDVEKIKGSDGNEIEIPQLGFKNLGSSGDAPVVIDLSARTVTVQSSTKVQPRPREEGSALPPAAFELTVKVGPGGDPGLPTFELGSGTNDVVVEADGNISIGKGYTDGLATFISKQGSVTLNPVAQALKWVEKEIDGIPTWVLENEVEVEAHPDYSGLVIYAEKDVTIANITDADWGIRGFVYARRNFNFEVNGQDATFYGTVVAGNDPGDLGAFNITGGDRATFIYDPDYLKLLTRTLPHQWTRVEALVWTEANG
jgi:hypothetical protein